MEIIRDFKEISKGDANLAGGKGASLGEMTRAGFPVPDGFVILSSTFDHFLHDTDLAQGIDTILKDVDHKVTNSVEEASNKIRGLIDRGEIPKNIANELMEAFKALQVELVAVRSSATAEDGQEHAWAGQLESYLNTSEENFLENIKKCWSSLFTPRAIFYRFETGLHQEAISIAVVVQKMVQSEVSGVAFSFHPITEDPSQLIIEAGLGLGESLVSGAITPDRYIVNKNSNQIIDKNLQGPSSCLTDDQILELSSLIIKIENHFGFPCDIEWALKDNKFYVLQSRPITTLKGVEHLEDFISYENPIYPYFYSAVMKAPQNKYKDRYLMGGWYVKFRYGKISLVEAPESSFKEFGEYFINLLLQNDNDFTDFLFTLGKDVISLGEKLEAINFNDLKDGHTTEIEDFYNDYEKVFSVALGIGYSLDYALDKYIQENNLTLSSINKKYHSFSQKEKSELKDIFETSEPDEATDKLKNHVLKYSWLQNDYSGEYRTDDKYFLNRRTKVLSEDPEWSYGVLEKPNSISDWIDFLTMVRDERKKCNLIVDGLLARYLKQKCEENKIEWKTAVMHTVEEFEKSKISGLREHGDTRIVEINHNGIKDISESEWQKHVGSREVETTDIIQGITANPGKVEGRAKIILSREDFHKIEDGDIIVASMTRPEFIQVLDKASAIITNEGGITSHAAIISRELNKPCIIGTKVATKVIKDGYLLEVDADHGIVKILNKN